MDLFDDRAFSPGYGRHLHFNPRTGALIRHGQHQVRLYKPGPPPQAMVKRADKRGWRWDRGGDQIDLARIIRRAQAYDAAKMDAVLRGEPHLRPLNLNDEIYCRFVERIPYALRQELLHYSERSWQLFSYLSRCGPSALELARTGGRALGFCLANIWVFANKKVQWELRRVRRLLPRKRTVIAGELGFPASKPVVKVLARVIPAALSIPSMFYLRGAVQQPEVLKRLGHVPRINRGCIALASDPRLLAHSAQSLLAEVGAGPHFEGRVLSLRRTFIDTLELVEERGLRPPVFRSLEQLYTTHDDLGMRARRRKPTRRIVFPDPPVPPTPSVIEHLPDNIALWEEATIQRNCLASAGYAQRCARGELVVYRMLKPQRCTLALRVHDDGIAVHDFATQSNRSPEPGAVLAARSWLERAGQAVDADPYLSHGRMGVERGGRLPPVRRVFGGQDPFPQVVGDYDDMPF